MGKGHGWGYIPVHLIDLATAQGIMARGPAVRQMLLEVATLTGARVGAGQLPLAGVLDMLWEALEVMHRTAPAPEPVPAEGQDSYCAAARSLRRSWEVLGWAPTPWMHWLAVHSEHFLRWEGTLYLFGTMPVERRHRRCKLDVARSYRGWHTLSEQRSRAGLAHVLRLSALDLVL